MLARLLLLFIVTPLIELWLLMLISTRMGPSATILLVLVTGGLDLGFRLGSVGVCRGAAALRRGWADFLLGRGNVCRGGAALGRDCGGFRCGGGGLFRGGVGLRRSWAGCRVSRI